MGANSRLGGSYLKTNELLYLFNGLFLFSLLISDLKDNYSAKFCLRSLFSTYANILVNRYSYSLQNRHSLFTD